MYSMTLLIPLFVLLGFLQPCVSTLKCNIPNHGGPCGGGQGCSISPSTGGTYNSTTGVITLNNMCNSLSPNVPSFFLTKSHSIQISFQAEYTNDLYLRFFNGSSELFQLCFGCYIGTTAAVVIPPNYVTYFACQPVPNPSGFGNFVVTLEEIPGGVLTSMFINGTKVACDSLDYTTLTSFQFSGYQTLVTIKDVRISSISPSCTPKLKTNKQTCQRMIKTCNNGLGIKMKWNGTPCKGSPGKSGCHCDQYCGYSCAKACKKDKQCFWQNNQCYNKLSGQPGGSSPFCAST